MKYPTEEEALDFAMDVVKIAFVAAPSIVIIRILLT